MALGRRAILLVLVFIEFYRGDERRPGNDERDFRDPKVRYSRSASELHSPFMGLVLAWMPFEKKLTVMFSMEVIGDELNRVFFFGKNGLKLEEFF